MAKQTKTQQRQQTPTAPAPKKGGRPYSLAYTAAGTPRRYLLSGIPAGLWIKIQAQAKREHIAVRQVILGLLEGWLFSRDPKTHAANALAAARSVITPADRQRLAESAERTRKRQAARTH